VNSAPRAALNCALCAREQINFDLRIKIYEGPIMADAASSDVIGLRERKAAATRAALANAVFERLQHRALGDITVEECAEAANVSRMTFFNYFPTKERALDFWLARWGYELTVVTTRKNVSGVRAILQVFDDMGDRVAAHPLAALRMYGYASTREIGPLPELTRADRELIAPGGPEAHQSVGADLMDAIEEAKRRGEITFEGSAYELSHFIGALLHGSACIGHSSPDTDFRVLFRRHVRRALGIGFGPFEELPAVAAPRVPARYRTKTEPKTKTRGKR
jgi:AcrR family transcriptional regulator